MDKKLYIDFAENYHMNLVPNPSQNKLWVLAACMAMPTLLGLKLGLTAMCVWSIVSTAIVLIMGAFTKKLGNVEVLNNIGLYFGVGVSYSWVFIQLAVRKIGFVFYFNAAFAVALLAGLVIGIFYTKIKVKRGAFVPKKRRQSRWFGAIGAALAFIATKLIEHFVGIDIFVILIAIVGYVLVFYGVPRLVLLCFQYYLLKKHRLVLK